MYIGSHDKLILQMLYIIRCGQNHDKTLFPHWKMLTLEEMFAPITFWLEMMPNSQTQTSEWKRFQNSP